MRLICPNCGAQYEVPVDVVPETGRDVQCSSCGHTWFQHHPDHEPEAPEDLSQTVPETEWVKDPSRPAAQTPPPPPPVDVPQEQVQPRGLDPEMAELFRQERDFEANLRAADTLESQPDLGLQPPDDDEHARRSRESRDRMARMRGEDPTPPPSDNAVPTDNRDQIIAQAAAAATAGSRRDLLPDVEEINQTLRSSSEPRVINTSKGDDLPTHAAKQSGGFGKGFFTMIVLAGLAIGLYAYAPQIVQKLPQAQPALETYVAKVDATRIWLDGQVTHLLVALDGMSSEAEPPTPPTADE